MRRTLVLPVIGSLALFAALGPLVPAVTQAAPGPAYNNGNTLTGTLVATPQSTLPATLLLQVGGQTVAVVVTSNTQVVDSANNTLSLSSLVDGDNLRVVGSNNQFWSNNSNGFQNNSSIRSQGNNSNRRGGNRRGGNNSGQFQGQNFNGFGGNNSNQFTASLIQDLSQSTTTTSSYQVTGTLDAEYTNLLCLSNSSVTSSAIARPLVTTNYCPSGDLPVYTNSGTTYENGNSVTISLGTLAIGDSLQANGSLNGGTFTASLVQDLSTTSTSTSNYQVTGTLDAEYPNELCLSNSSVVSSAIARPLVTTNYCPNGDLPVYLNSGTSYENSISTVIALGSLGIGNSLEATGTLSNGQFTASLVQDLSI